MVNLPLPDYNYYSGEEWLRMVITSCHSIIVINHTDIQVITIINYYIPGWWFQPQGKIFVNQPTNQPFVNIGENTTCSKPPARFPNIWDWFTLPLKFINSQLASSEIQGTVLGLHILQFLPFFHLWNHSEFKVRKHVWNSKWI